MVAFSSQTVTCYQCSSLGLGGSVVKLQAYT